MFSTLRKFLVIFLTMLQFIVPLVHAHASERSSGQGLHVPGLERYSVESNALIAQMKALQFNYSAEGMIVDVHMGLKQSRTKSQSHSDNSHYLPQQTVALDTAIFSLDSHFSPQPKQLFYSLFVSSPPSRAPPAQ